MIIGVVVGVIVVVSLVALFAVALATAAGRADGDLRRGGRALADLGALRSPSGKSFFPGTESVRNLIGALEELCEDLPRTHPSVDWSRRPGERRSVYDRDE